MAILMAVDEWAFIEDGRELVESAVRGKVHGLGPCFQATDVHDAVGILGYGAGAGIARVDAWTRGWSASSPRRGSILGRAPPSRLTRMTCSIAVLWLAFELDESPDRKRCY